MTAAAELSVRKQFVNVRGLRLHCAVAGHGDRLMLLLHGFPDCWHGWSAQLGHFARHFTVVAPDGRGCNLSDKPGAVDDYALQQLVEDAAALVEHFGGGRPAVVAGHDWGGVVAWSLAAMHPQAASHLVVLNAPHPRVLADAIMHDPSQRAASEYLRRLRQPDAEAILSADSYARLRATLDCPDAVDWRRDPYVAACVNAWSQPGALTERSTGTARMTSRDPSPLRTRCRLGSTPRRC
jgi:pimeloyl-ACP methyl ester carboxylesterase